MSPPCLLHNIAVDDAVKVLMMKGEKRCCRSLPVRGFLQRDACSLPSQTTESKGWQKAAQVDAHYYLQRKLLYTSPHPETIHQPFKKTVPYEMS